MKIIGKTLKQKKVRLRTKSNSIPVVVDNNIDLPEYNMVRFVYYSIDASDNPKSYNLKVKDQAVPFLLIEFQGIIHSPLRGTRFGTAGSIDELFDLIEGSGDFFVDTNDLWIPLSLFSCKPARGEVYRISKELFGLALKFRNDKIELENYRLQADKYRDEVFFSVSETSAFNEWSEKVVREAKEIYPKNGELKLSY